MIVIYAFTMLYKARQTKSETVQVNAERLYTLANDAFAKIDKDVVESLLVGFFINDLFHDYLRMKVMWKILRCEKLLYKMHWLNKI